MACLSGLPGITKIHIVMGYKSFPLDLDLGVYW